MWEIDLSTKKNERVDDERLKLVASFFTVDFRGRQDMRGGDLYFHRKRRADGHLESLGLISKLPPQTLKLQGRYMYRSGAFHYVVSNLTGITYDARYALIAVDPSKLQLEVSQALYGCNTQRKK